ncbi:MAG: aminotransferase class I/II-fold pyridoxal phosphate-dependent enzyme [Flavobacteriales bacterium]|nr:aminotransferase class I/II-fold pyridoxal phosphate-dependent enzyme [Flavobacteriales bacterium]
MPRLSLKGQQMPESPIRKLVPYATAAKAAGKKVYHLNIGQPDIETPEVALNAVRNLDRKVIEYSNSEGYASYREGLAKYYRGVGIDISSSDIMVTTGGSEALIFGFMTCMDPGDEIIIPEPFYANYNGFATMAGLNVKPITARIEDGFALPPISEFERRITENTRAILICNPGNPTGTLYGKESLEKLAALVKKYDLFLFADEVYREFCYETAIPFSTMNLKGIEQNVVMIDSVSKRYSMCGVRVGALVSRNKQLMANALKFAQARLSPPTLGQIASEAALDTPQEYFDRVKDEYVQRRNTLVDGLNAIEGVICPKPAGAFYVMAQLPVDSGDRFCQWMLEDFDLDGETVMMAPGSGFYSTRAFGEKQVRIAYVLNEADLKRSIKIIEEGLKAYPGRIA